VSIAYPVMVSRAIVLRGLVACACGVAGRSTAAAQSTEARAFGVEEVVRTALDAGIDLRLARRQLLSAEAGRDVASAPFAAQLRAFVLSASDRTLTEGTSNGPVSTVTSRSTRYGVTLDKLLRSGIVLSPSIAVSRADLSSSPLPPPNRAVVSMGMTVPLLRGLGSSPVRAGELAAVLDAEAGVHDVRQSAARTVQTAMNAYWEYLGAYRRLEVQQQAERRAEDLANETRALVLADERAPSELQSLNANAALKRITRVAAEQGVVEARQRLGVALGVPADEVLQLGAPRSMFPVPQDLNPPDSVAADVLARTAPSRRPDFEAARGRQQSALAVASGSAADARSKLDLLVAVGYAGAERGTTLRQFYTPLYSGVAGMNSTVQMTFQPAGSVGGARGRREQAEAAVQRTGIVVADLTRIAISSTRVAIEALRSARLQLETAELAVELSQRSVQSEMERFRHGMSTRFDVIQSEDALTGALLSRIAAQTLAAQAVVRLRYESGRLVTGDALRGLTVDTQALLRSTTSGW
jgi:outer membrane protein